jgi:hypothetical protein
VPAGDPIQRLKSGSGWGTREPLIRRSKSKHFTIPGIGYRIVANKNTLRHPANLRMMTTSRLLTLEHTNLAPTQKAIRWYYDAPLVLLLRT